MFKTTFSVVFSLELIMKIDSAVPQIYRGGECGWRAVLRADRYPYLGY